MRRVLALFALVLILCSQSVWGGVPRTLSYQGILTDASDVIVPDGSYSITFRIYDADEDGNMLWEEAQSVAVVSGRFNAILGKSTSLDPLGFDIAYWLAMKVESDPEMTPRIELASSGYSMNARTVEAGAIHSLGAADGSPTDAVYVDNDANVGIGTTTPEALVHIVKTDRPTIRLEHAVDGTDIGSYTDIVDASANQFSIDKYNPSGAVLMEISPNPLDGTNEAKVRFFRGTNTTGNKKVQFCAGDGTSTVHAKIGVDGVDSAFQLGGGNFGIGTNNPTSKLHVEGRTETKTLEITGGMDVAEPFEMSGGEILSKGSVVVIDSENPGKLKLSESPYDRRVAGVVSGAGGINPGLTLTQTGMTDGGQNVALGGRVYVLASTCNGPIKAGDLLTTSNTPGHAMLASDRDRTHGAIIGKAMTDLDQGDGLVLVLVSLQ